VNDRKWQLVVCLAVLALWACAHAALQEPASAVIEPAGAPDSVAAAEPAAPASYRPLHQGHIDLSTGLYFREDDDLVLNTAMPVVLRRTYDSGDGFPRQFGINTTHPGEWWLHGGSDPRVPWAELILADGGRIRFTRISPGFFRASAVLRHEGTPTEFAGALLSWSASTWNMKFRDGSLAVFHDCSSRKEHCSLLERRDSKGHRIDYVRDATQTLLRIQSEGQSISFAYDHDRIVRAFDTSGHVMTYAYDGNGRLIHAASDRGVVRSYTYDYRHELIAIREPGRIVRNWYDESGRVSRQEVRWDDDDDPYVATVRYVVADGAIVQTDFDEGNGVERSRYNRSHYVVSEVFDAEGRIPMTFAYDRDERTNVVRGATLWCGAPTGSFALSVPAAVEHDTDAKWALMQKHCQRQTIGRSRRSLFAAAFHFER
jgi:YD repeat-containing protein